MNFYGRSQTFAVEPRGGQVMMFTPEGLRLAVIDAYYSRALAADPDDGWTNLFMGNLYCGLSCYDEAESHFKRAIELLPDVACPHWCLADVYDKQGYWSHTEKQYRRAVEIDPSDTKSKQKLDERLANKPE